MAKRIKVVQGDITTQDVMALLTFANPQAVWNGGVDFALRKRFGDIYHRQLKTHWETGLFRKTGQTLIIEGEDKQPSVVFVCDDIAQLKPLKDVLLPALEVAYMHGIKSIAIPVVRTGPVFYMIENYDPNSAERDLIEALKAFEHPMEIAVVVYNDSEQADRLRGYLVS